MIIYHLAKRLRRAKILLFSRGWGKILSIMAALYLIGYGGMVVFGESKVVEAYDWWFVVTNGTVGYGDVAPVTVGGRRLAEGIIVIGIGLTTIIITKIIEGVLKMTERKITGAHEYDFRGHLVVLGYVSGVTESLVAELLAEESRDYPIVLCADNVERNPFYFSKEACDRVHFVRGDIASDDVLMRSSASHASGAIICGSDDSRSFHTAFAFRQINMSAHMVVSVTSPDMRKRISQLPSNDSSSNQAILQNNAGLLAQEVQDPKSADVIQDLVSNTDGASLYRIDVPSGAGNITFERLFDLFRRTYGVTLLSVEVDRSIAPISNPPLNTIVSGGMALFYVADRKLGKVEWSM